METKNLIEFLNQNKVPTSLIEELLTLPDEIKALESRLIALNIKLSLTQGHIDLWELNESRSIAEEFTTDGKKVFPNETIREAELEARKRRNDDFRRLNEENTNYQYEKDKEEVNAKHLERRFRAMITIANLISNK